MEDITTEEPPDPPDPQPPKDKDEKKKNNTEEIHSFFSKELLDSVEAAIALLAQSHKFGTPTDETKKDFHMKSVSMFFATMMEKCGNDLSEIMYKMGVQRIILDHIPRKKYYLPKSYKKGGVIQSTKELLEKNKDMYQRLYRKKSREEKKKEREQEWRAQAIQRGRMVFNELCGTAGSYGFDDVPVTIIEEAMEVLIENDIVTDEKRRGTRGNIGQALIHAMLITIGEYYQDIMTLKEDASPRYKATVDNRRKDLLKGIIDYITIVHNTCLSNVDSKFALLMKIPIIKEYFQAIREKHFNPPKLCRLMDTSLKLNMRSLNLLISMMSYYHKKTDQTIDDLTSNVGVRGGNSENRITPFPSQSVMSETRRDIEGRGIQLFGSYLTNDHKASGIDLKRFIELYLFLIKEALDEDDFDGDNVCKHIIYLDLTNDGTEWSSMKINACGIKCTIVIRRRGGSRKPILRIPVVLPTNIFISKDNQKNLYLYHKAVYNFVQKELVDALGRMYVRSANDTFIFKIKFAYSGDLKCHALSCGLNSLVGTSQTDFMYCCMDCHKKTQLAYNLKKCLWCVTYNKANCRHIPCVPKRWMLPKVYQDYQPIINVFAGKCQQWIRNRKVGEEITCSTLNDDEIVSSGPVKLEYIECIDCDGVVKSGDSKRIVALANRFQQYSTPSITVASKAKEYIRQDRPRDISLNKRNTANDANESTTVLSLDNAKLEELQYHLRIRVCHDRTTMEGFNQPAAYGALNVAIIKLLREKYNFDVDQSIKNEKNLEKQSKDILYILLLAELYVIYFVTEQKKIGYELIPLVEDKLLLVICDLHMEMRIGLQLIEDLLNHCCMNIYKYDFAIDMIHAIEDYWNTQVFRSPGSGASGFEFKIKEDKTIDTVHLTDKKLGKVLVNINGLIDLMHNFRQDEQSKERISKNISSKHTLEKYRSVFHGFIEILKQLRQFNDTNTDEDFILWQLNIVDPWFDEYIDIFGHDHVGYYVHFLARGHICEQLLLFRNIHRHSQQTWEGLMGVIKKYLAGHTQHSGNGGNKQETLAQAILRYIVRMAMYTLFPEDDKLAEQIAIFRENPEREKGIAGALSVDKVEDAMNDTYETFTTGNTTGQMLNQDDDEAEIVDEQLIGFKFGIAEFEGMNHIPDDIPPEFDQLPSSNSVTTSSATAAASPLTQPTNQNTKKRKSVAQVQTLLVPAVVSAEGNPSELVSSTKKTAKRRKSTN